MAGAIEQAMEAEGTFVAINNRISQSVPHVHIHIVPHRKKDGLKGFFWPRNPYKDEAALLKTQKAIQKEVALIQKVSAPEVWIGIASRLRASQVLGRDRASPRGSAMKTQNRGSYYAETRGT